jgi:hypothetical protein
MSSFSIPDSIVLKKYLNDIQGLTIRNRAIFYGYTILIAFRY